MTLHCTVRSPVNVLFPPMVWSHVVLTVGRVIFAVPLNHTPLIVLDVWSAVAVAALFTVMVSGT